MGREAAEVVGRRERQAEEVACRGDAGQGDVEGCRGKKMVTPAARREAVALLRVAYEVSERRACSVLGADRTSVRYRGRRADDASIRARLRELAGIRRRFGDPRPHILLTRESNPKNHKKPPPPYPRERPPARPPGPRPRARGPRSPMTLPQGPKQRRTP